MTATLDALTVSKMPTITEENYKILEKIDELSKIASNFEVKFKEENCEVLDKVKHVLDSNIGELHQSINDTKSTLDQVDRLSQKVSNLELQLNEMKESIANEIISKIDIKLDSILRTRAQEMSKL